MEIGMRRRYLLALAAGAVLFSACTVQPPPKPNILFLLTDDHRADAIGALGNPVIKTPNIDSIANSGFVFTNAYNLGANVPAVCLPSRNMLLSGRAYTRWEGRFAPPEPANLADAMKSAGYETWHQGKKGNTAEEIHKRFDHTQYVANDLEARSTGEPGEEIVDNAIEFLTGRQRQQPFFMYLAFAAPHDPRIAAPAYRGLYDPGEIPLPKNYLPVHPFDNGEMVIRDELLAPWPRTGDEIRRHLHDYYATISGLDHHIGRLLQHLKDTGLYENTIIVFAADQGLAIGSHGLMGKQNLYEHSAKAPLFISGPDIPQGRSNALVYLLDVFPTLCSLVGAPQPQGADGATLAPIMYGQDVRVRRTLFLAYRDVQRSIRDDRYKLILYPHNGTTQLFDLENDPDEINNLATNPDFAHRVEAMTNALAQWQEIIGDNAPLVYGDPSNPRFTPPTGQALRDLRAKWNME